MKPAGIAGGYALRPDLAFQSIGVTFFQIHWVGGQSVKVLKSYRRSQKKHEKPHREQCNGSSCKQGGTFTKMGASKYFRKRNSEKHTKGFGGGPHTVEGYDPISMGTLNPR